MTHLIDYSIPQIPVLLIVGERTAQECTHRFSTKFLF